MKWENHKFLSAIFLYTFNAPFEAIIIGIAGSIFPDFIEYIVKLRHRGISHFWGIYTLIVLTIYFTQKYLLLNNPLLFIIKWLCIGALLHILEDSLSKSGINLTPWHSKKIPLKGLYKTGLSEENKAVFILVVVLISIKFLLVNANLSSWKIKFSIFNTIKFY